MTAAHSCRVLLTTDAVGGIWTYTVDLARGLSALGIGAVIAVMGPSPSAAQKKAARAVPGLRLVDTGLPLDWLAEDAGALADAGRALARLAAKEQVDLVQLNAPALAAQARFPMPVVAVVHSCVATWWHEVYGPDAAIPADFAWRTDLVRAGLAAADLVVAPSNAFAALVRNCYGLGQEPRTVYNGRSPIAAGQQAPHDFVFTAGRLWDRGKNLATLDAAAAGIGVPVHAAGPLEGPNGERIAFEHLNSLGTLDEAALGRWLSARPVFASAALYEPFGLSVLEAAAAGCPLVLADIPTFRELWRDVAIFVDPRDPAAFARACNELVGDDFERAVLGRAAMERAEFFTPDAMAAQMASLYRGLLPAVRGPVLAARAAA
jgi:glycosyltransferase involved in cell wall biosynthesis